MQYNLYEPINLKGDRIRFLCEHDGNNYVLHMGNKMYRKFNDETLPVELKTLIGMINGIDWDKLHSGVDRRQNPYQPNANQEQLLLWTPLSYYPEVSLQIGWRVKNKYALIVPYNYFLTLSGAQASEYDRGHDPRSESQSEGEADTG